MMKAEAIFYSIFALVLLAAFYRLSTPEILTGFMMFVVLVFSAYKYLNQECNLEIGLQRHFILGHKHIFYDGQHHAIHFGWVYIAWVGKPYLD